MDPAWYVRTLILLWMVAYISGEEFTSSSGETWTIPDVSYPDPTFVYNIEPAVSVQGKVLNLKVFLLLDPLGLGRYFTYLMDARTHKFLTIYVYH